MIDNLSSSNSLEKFKTKNNKTFKEIIPDTLCFVIEETLIMGILVSMFCLI